jgi:hypothetical protein
VYESHKPTCTILAEHDSASSAGGQSLQSKCLKNLRPYYSKRLFKIKLKILAERKLGWGFKG